MNNNNRNIESWCTADTDILKSNVSSVGPSSEGKLFLPDEGPTLETLDFTIRIGSTPIILYFDLYLLCLRSTLNVYE